MSVTERASRVRSPFQLSLLSKNTLIAMLLVAFFALHVLAGAIIQGATSMRTAPTQEGVGASSYD